MKLNLKVVVFLAIVVALAGCVQHSPSKSITTYSNCSVNYVKYAKNFKLEYCAGYKILKVREGNEWVTSCITVNYPALTDGASTFKPLRAIIGSSGRFTAAPTPLRSTLFFKPNFRMFFAALTSLSSS